MRRFIATSACTILLSLLGASGLNQNSFNILNESSANLYPTSVEQSVTDTEGQNLLNYNKEVDAEEIAASVNADQKGYSPIDLDKTEVKGATVTKKSTVATCADKNKVNCKKGTKKCSEGNCTDAKKCISNKGKSLTYKNIDLSKCKNTKEVIKKLQANGINITTSNIKNNKAIANIIKSIKKNATCQGSCSAEATNEVAAKANKDAVKADKATTVTKPATTKTSTTSTTTSKPVAPKTTTTPTTASKPAATGVTNTPTTNNSSISSFASQVLQLVNKERAKQGLSALTTNSTLQAAADVRAKETVSSFSHTRPDGTSFSSVLKEFNISYQTAGENIAYGQKTPQEVVTGWMNSPGHRANILNSNYGKIGIGVYKASNGRIYWSQLFTN